MAGRKDATALRIRSGSRAWIGRGPFLAIGSVLLAAPLLACASGPPKSRFEREFERYRSLPHQKAMAIVGDPENRWSYGIGYAFRSPGLARDAALAECNVRRKSLGPDAVCEVYAVGNEVVWEGR